VGGRGDPIDVSDFLSGLGGIICGIKTILGRKSEVDLLPQSVAYEITVFLASRIGLSSDDIM